jgi:hypothetical protein
MMSRASAWAWSRAAVGALAILLGLSPQARGQSLETAVKATYLYKFAPFVEWPSKAFETPTSPLMVCVQGEDPFGPLLDRAIAGQKIGGHPVQARRLDAVDAASGCNIVFVSGSRRQPQAEALKVLHGSGALTVTDGGGGAIRFVMQNDRVRFEIDTAEVASDGLTLSSKLLSLAVNARPRP